MTLKRNQVSASRKHERGITFLIVALMMFVVLAMAALAIDVSTLYLAHTEAQRAADAAALAAAKAFVYTGATSDTPGGTLQTVSQTVAQQAIDAALQQNKIAGSPGTLVGSPTFDFTRPGNPLVTVKVQQTGLPTFFARIWRGGLNTVSATATAEAFNPSGTSANPPTSAQCVKPFIVPNLDPVNGGTFINADSSLAHPGPASSGGIVGEEILFTADCRRTQPGCQARSGHTPPTTGPGSPPTLDYVPADIPPPSGNLVCPACGGGASTDFENNIACCNPTSFVCNAATQTSLGAQPWQADLTVNPRSSGATENGLECLIHQPGQDNIDIKCPDCPDLPGLPGLAFHIHVGNNNPLVVPGSAVKSNDVIMTSDSIITIPIFDQTAVPGGLDWTQPTPPITVIGYMQVFVKQANSGAAVTGSGAFDGVVLNVAGCGSNTATASPIVGGGISPIPVRLVQ